MVTIPFGMKPKALLKFMKLNDQEAVTTLAFNNIAGSSHYYPAFEARRLRQVQKTGYNDAMQGLDHVARERFAFVMS